MRKNSSSKWDSSCEEAFMEVKKILASPPIMGKPDDKSDLQLHLAVTETTVSATLTQEAPDFKLIYFVSRVLKETEVRYKQIEKVALALVTVSRRLRPYFQSHQVVVRTDHPIAKILRKPDLAGQIVGWSVELSEFGLRFESRGSVRGQHLAEFASELLPNEENSLQPWKLFVDGSFSGKGGGAGAVLEGPNGLVVEQSLIFQFKISNNQVEYEALIAGLELAKDLGAEYVKCRTDSQLVVDQMKGDFQIKDDHLLQYFHRATNLTQQFKTIKVTHIPREENTRALILSKLSKDKDSGQLTSIVRQIMTKPTIDCMSVSVEPDWEDWRHEIMMRMKEQEEGQGVSAKDAKRITRYVLIGGELYKRGFVMPLLKCISQKEAEYVLRELHEGVCGMHTRKRALRARVLRAGYFWPTLEKDCNDFVCKCLSCQKHGNMQNLPTTKLHILTSPWPFSKCGMDIVRPFPTGIAQKKFLLVAVDYFTKWVKAEPLATISAAQVQKFVWKIVYRFGLPKIIVTDNGRQFIDRKLTEFYRSLGIKHVTSSVEHP
ncbi:uncharacterized protein LOC108330410 [Vigna angularis]|uniref:uncharacterized protein LOC108330410 n=1 Tax=Phaseolus angularis TaxID=3914 RepID=UPI00080A63BE|nr:uncharacterized protein LOC108330410 [Vigna angularis]